MRLCKKSFLSLWAHANLHTAQDLRGGKGSAKEFADVLVVFGDDVIIFSDKHIEFQADRDLSTAWPRWFRRAVTESAKQLHGAMSWMRRFPDRIFLDAQCTRPLPMRLPPPERARFHLVAITRGSQFAAQNFFQGNEGSLLINTGIEGQQHEETPFTIGILDRSKHFVHVLDEFSLEVVMDEMDTITDFVEYLTAREQFLVDPAISVWAEGEEQLVASFLSNTRDDRHAFLSANTLACISTGAGDQRPCTIFLDGSHYPALLSRSEYKAKRRRDARSRRVWDELLERFIQTGDPRIAHPDIDQTAHDTEEALRVMAAESRFRRGLITDMLGEMFGIAQGLDPTRRYARVFASPELRDNGYVFLMVPKSAEESYEDYRRYRVSLLYAYCAVAKLSYPEINTFVGIALDSPVRVYAESSEDVIIYQRETLTPEEAVEAEGFQREFGILGSHTKTRGVHRTEFPSEPNVIKPSNARKPSADKKRKTKLKKTAQRRNRI